MRHIIAGTAGHIDHGKTALVGALTGIETDRLAEEKRRGISIELGFAHLELGEGVRVGFIDVPGHERFVRTMLAGTAGIDVVLLVIAADESIKPQTREHFEICRLLGVRDGVVVITKCDLVDGEMVELVKLEAADLVRGSFLDGAPMVAVSAKTGEGLEALKAELASAAARVKAKDAGRHFRLSVDRAFAMKGFGTVVTGTLIAGRVALEEEVELHPAGLRARVRGIEVHGEKVREAVAGQRTALNLAGVDVGDVARGMTLTAPGVFTPVRAFDAEFNTLPDAPKLKARTPVHFHLGAAEMVAELRHLDDGFARFVFSEPVLALPGDRFIVRRFSPVETIGGGVVLNIAPVRAKDAPARLRALSSATPAEAVAMIAAEGAYGAGLSDLMRRTGWMPEAIAAAAKGLVEWRAPERWWIAPAQVSALTSALRDALKAFHRETPLAEGMPKEELRARVTPGAEAFVLDALLGAAKDVVAASDKVRLASHRVAFREDETAALAKIAAAFERAGLGVPAVGDVLAGCGVEERRARQLLQMLLKSGTLVRIGDELLFHQTAIAQLKATLAARKGAEFRVAEFKEWTGVSRKYSIPLLEWLDRERITRRVGDTRVIL